MKRKKKVIHKRPDQKKNKILVKKQTNFRAKKEKNFFLIMSGYLVTGKNKKSNLIEKHNAPIEGNKKKKWVPGIPKAPHKR
jgi:hypothetical protein